MHLQVLPSTVCAEAGPYVSIRQLSVCPCDLWSTFHAAAGHSVNFRQLFERPWDLPSTLRASTVPLINFRQLFMCPWDLSKCSVRPLDRLSSSSTFRVAAASSINFPYNHGTIHQLSICPWYLLSTFHTFAGHSVKFRQLFVRPSNYPSIFRASAESSVNFRQLSMHPRDLSSTFRASV